MGTVFNCGEGGLLLICCRTRKTRYWLWQSSTSDCATKESAIAFRSLPQEVSVGRGRCLHHLGSVDFAGLPPLPQLLYGKMRLGNRHPTGRFDPTSESRPHVRASRESASRLDARNHGNHGRDGNQRHRLTPWQPPHAPRNRPVAERTRFTRNTPCRRIIFRQCLRKERGARMFRLFPLVSSHFVAGTPVLEEKFP